MFYILLALAIFVFWWYYKTYGKEDFLNKASRGAKGFGRGFIQGVVEERMDELKQKINYYVVALLAKIAKSDGRVSEQEADMITQILNANAKNERERMFLKASFNEHKDKLDDVFEVAKDFIKEVPLPYNERLNILNMLVFMASIDGAMNDKKQSILELIAKAFDIPKSELLAFIQNLKNFKSSSKKLSVDEAYKILDLAFDSDLSSVKKRYRELAKKYHPDVLNANNVNKEELEAGVEKFQKVNEAYETIKKHLGEK